MKLHLLAILYGLIGVGFTIGYMVRTKPHNIIDAILLVVLWPLYGPFLLFKPTEETQHNTAQAATASGRVDDDLLIALKRAEDSPLAPFLPDMDTSARLSQRLKDAQQRVHDIELLLKQPAYDEASALKKQAALEEDGDPHSARMIDQRLHIIRRLRALKDRVSLEINQISELLVQLHIQAEVVRIAGLMDDDTKELVDVLLYRIQGLEEFMQEQPDGLTP